MPNIYEGNSGSLADRQFAVVVSTYHLSITSKLQQGALNTFLQAGVPEEQLHVLKVPGAWELPLATAHLVGAARVDGVVCLGCVIRGETTHDQHINTAVSNELARLATESRIPIAFGVLTCQTLDQAIARSGGEVGNKGIECAEAVIQMVRLASELP